MTARSELEIDYSPSSMVDDIGPLVQRYAGESAAVRAALGHSTWSYGPGPDEYIDVFAPSSSSADGPARVHVFFHGGYWQELGREDASFPAPEFVARGVTYAAPGYTLAPRATLATIVGQARRAVTLIAAEHMRMQRRRPSIVVSGSSAGAHLAAMVVLTDWAGHGFHTPPVDGAVLVSGIYDLRPLVDTYVNDPLGLDEAEAWDLSPARIVGEAEAWPAVRTVVAVGEIETAAFRHQSEAFAELVASRGGAVEVVDAAGRNHFDIVHDLGRRGTALGDAVLELEAAIGWPDGAR